MRKSTLAAVAVVVVVLVGAFAFISFSQTPALPAATSAAKQTVVVTSGNRTTTVVVNRTAPAAALLGAQFAMVPQYSWNGAQKYNGTALSCAKSQDNLTVSCQLYAPRSGGNWTLRVGAASPKGATVVVGWRNGGAGWSSSCFEGRSAIRQSGEIIALPVGTAQISCTVATAGGADLADEFALTMGAAG
jgi:hypothetical protein